MTRTDEQPRPLPQGETPEQLREKIGEEVGRDGVVADIFREYSDGDGEVMVEVAVLLRQVIALTGGEGRAPDRRSAIVRSKAEEALLYAMFGDRTGAK